VRLRTLNLALAVALGMSSIAHAAAPTPSRTLVEVNGEAVKESHFLVYRAQRGAEHKQLDKKAQLALLNELVSTVMIAQDAVKQGLDKQPQLMAAMDVARYRILAEAAVQQYLQDHPVTDKDVAAAYKARYGDNKLVEYKARHILLTTEDEAKAVIAELDKGGDFAKLAKEKSTGPSGANGGDLGWFEQGQMVAPFGNAVAAMEKGGHSEAPVHTRFGWHVIQLEDTREQTPPKLADVHDQLQQQLQRQRISDYVKAMRDKAKVKILEQEQG
jgi:peptidyl-prolyl cis-trans isomerase C